MIVDKVCALLDRVGVVYTKVEHAPVVTSQDAAAVRHTDISAGVKAIIFIADKTPVMICVPGDKRIDTKFFKTTFQIKDLRMATAEELLQLTDLEKGAVPPLGSIFGIRSYYSAELISKGDVSFNAGSRSVSITMSATDLISVENPIIPKNGDFAVLS